jgi:hypothetical protein
VVAPEPTPEMHIEDDDEPGFHRTDTTDFGVLLSGNMALELDDGAECCCLPATSWWRTELATVGAWLGTCRPPWRLSSSERTAVRFRPARAVATAMNRRGREVGVDSKPRPATPSFSPRSQWSSSSGPSASTPVASIGLHHLRELVSPDAGVCWLECTTLPWFTRADGGVCDLPMPHLNHESSRFGYSILSVLVTERTSPLL